MAQRQSGTTIGRGQVVSIHYTLTNDEGEVLDTSRGGEPLAYLHGAGNIVPGLEAALEGRKAGDQLQVTVAPEDGYGDAEEDGVQVAQREDFPADAELEVGMHFIAENEDGEEVPVWIRDIEGDDVTLDFNHPLAGVTLHFDVEVAGVRIATADEVAHGHPHGPGGHAH